MNTTSTPSAIVLTFLPLLVGVAPMRATANSGDAEWPVNKDALHFLWENSRARNEVQDEATGRYRQFRGQLQGRAWYGPHFEMRLARGAFRPEGVDVALLESCRRAQELGIELVFRPDMLTPDGTARIVTFGGEGAADFSIDQRGRSIVLQLSTAGSSSEERGLALFELESVERWHHLIVSYRPGMALAFLNGEQVFSSGQFQGNLAWGPAELLFGDAVGGGHDWAGRLEGIAIHSRFIPREEAQKRHALYSARLRDRKSPEEIAIEAKLLETVPPRSLAAMGSYRRGLVEHSYEVLDVLKGNLEGKKIIAAHWAVMDRKKVGKARTIGSTYRLRLEPWTQHPQLDSELIETLESDAELPVFLDIGSATE